MVEFKECLQYGKLRDVSGMETISFLSVGYAISLNRINAPWYMCPWCAYISILGSARATYTIRSFKLYNACAHCLGYEVIEYHVAVCQRWLSFR